MFTPEENEIIDTSHNGDFKLIKSENYDGSYIIDVFDLYKCYKEGNYLVIEQGQIVHENTLQGCLDYIHKWL